MHYIAIIHKEEDSVYGVSFPDFPGCISAGDTLDEAIIGAGEALYGHVRMMRADGDLIPPARSYEEIMQDPELADVRHDAIFSAIPLIHNDSVDHKSDPVVDRLGRLMASQVRTPSYIVERYVDVTVDRVVERIRPVQGERVVDVNIKRVIERIRGSAPKIEELFHEKGIYTFNQLSEPEIQWLRNKLLEAGR
jgi:predicted RNase H-like HicB family nuclease